MRFRTAIGAAAVLAGFLVAFDRGVAGVLDFSYVAVTVVGAFAIVQGLRYANARRGTERRSLDPGEPERRARAVVPGTDFDEDVDRSTGAGRRRYKLRNRLRDRVRTAAIAAVARDRDCARSRATDLVESGEWTDDPIAAAFLAPEVSYPIAHRVRTRLLGRSCFRTGLDAAMDAIERTDPLNPLDPRRSTPADAGAARGGDGGHGSGDGTRGGGDGGHGSDDGTHDCDARRRGVEASR